MTARDPLATTHYMHRSNGEVHGPFESVFEMVAWDHDNPPAPTLADHLDFIRAARDTYQLRVAVHAATEQFKGDAAALQEIGDEEFLWHRQHNLRGFFDEDDLPMERF